VRAGVGKTGWHTFRHSYSTLLRRVGAEIKVQQQLLRHSTIQCAMIVYTQAMPEGKRPPTVCGGVERIADRALLGSVATLHGSQ